MSLDALPVQQVRINADTAPPEPVSGGWRGEIFLLGVIGGFHIWLGLEIVVARQTHGDGDYGLEAGWCCEVGDGWALDLARGVEEKHAQPD